MTRPPARRGGTSLAGLGLSLMVPSTAIVQKYSGLTGVAAYFALAALALWLVHTHILPVEYRRASPRHFWWWFAASLIVLLVAFWIVYPLVNSGLPGRGSDRDEALNIATSALLHGRFPYRSTTYLGNPISPMPGSLILAAPFVLLGNGAYQNVFWMAAFVLTLGTLLEDRWLALVLLWDAVLLCPAVLHEYVTGGDMLANGLCVLVPALWLLRSTARHDAGGGMTMALAILVGVSLASRANFILILPLLLAGLVEIAGRTPALKIGAVVGAALALATVPFYLYDPGAFAPLHAADKLGQFQDVLPLAGFVVPLASGAVAVGLAVRRPVSFPRDSAIVLAIPVLAGVMLQSIQTGRVNLGFADFGVAFVFFGIAASAGLSGVGR